MEQRQSLSEVFAVILLELLRADRQSREQCRDLDGGTPLIPVVRQAHPGKSATKSHMTGNGLLGNELALRVELELMSFRRILGGRLYDDLNS